MQYTVRSGDTLSRIAAKHGTSLQALLDANPRYRANPNAIAVGDVIQIPSGAAPGLAEAAPPAFAPPVTEWMLGSLSSKYETGGRGPGTVSTGIGDAGGVSYGSYQMTSKPNGGTVARFVGAADFPWRERFAGLASGAAGFSTQWKALAAEAHEAFFEAQHEYIKRTHFDPLVRKVAAEDGLEVTTRAPAVQDAVWSTAVQHGPNTPVVHRAIVAAGGAAALQPADLERDRRLIVAIYGERGRRNEAGGLVYFSRNSKAVQDGVARRFRDEERDALAMLGRGV
ncbi:MAG TPA: LysM peptidoglycan-binding domain-containing protein [Geminicoccaceae bacterium]|nr:LysM peptidoglycan-binding domain-containing protein [Geminicoccaceae bacterium]